MPPLTNLEIAGRVLVVIEEWEGSLCRLHWEPLFSEDEVEQFNRWLDEVRAEFPSRA